MRRLCFPVALRGEARCGLGVGRVCAVSVTRQFSPQTLYSLGALQVRRCFSGGSAAERTEHHKFKAETEKLLQILAHSLYTDKDIFLRELLSNASDALEKRRFLENTQQQQEGSGLTPRELRVLLRVDPQKKLFIIEDSGVGMSKTDLLDSLGTLAKSGAEDFRRTAGVEAAKDIIGQFGVGFYSSFVVSKEVEVFTRPFASAGQGQPILRWISDGRGGYSVSEVSAHGEDGLPSGGAFAEDWFGTRIVCHLREDCLQFANAHAVKELAAKFSSFINFPIYVEESGKETLVSSQTALWMKPNATEEEHLQFYRHVTNRPWDKPFASLLFQADAPLSIRAALYIPEEAPSKLFVSKLSCGVSLYCRRVLVQKEASKCVPKWLWFLNGAIDCEDIPLNVSRENTQDSAVFANIKRVVERRFLKLLTDMEKKEPAKYKEFYRKYCDFIKEGVLDAARGESDSNAEELMKLLRFECSEKEAGEAVSLEEYLQMANPKQQNIYYYCCNSRATGLASPYMEEFLSRKRPVLLLTAEIDEFLAMNLETFAGKKFVSIDAGEGDFELDLGDGPEKAEEEGAPKLVGEQQNALAGYVKDVLGPRVRTVNFATRLRSSPAVVISEGLSPKLRKILKAATAASSTEPFDMTTIPVTLELNPSHELITALFHLKDSNPDVAKLLVEQLFDSACLAGGVLDDPKTMLSRVYKLLSLTAQFAFHHSKQAGESDSSETSS